MPYYIRDGEEMRGPLDSEQVYHLWNSGMVSSESMCREECSEQWVPITTIVAARAALRAMEDAPKTAVKAPTKKKSKVAEVLDEKVAPGEARAIFGILFLVVFVLIVFRIGASLGTSSPSRSSAGPAGLVSIVGNIYPGTDVYDRNGKFVGRILEADPDYRNPVTGEKYRRILFLNADGSVEEKLWDSVVHFPWYVKK